MAKRTMSGPVTHQELRAELAHVPTKAELKAELERYATKADLKAELERYATKADLKAELERFATKADLERFATKVDLEVWGGALLARIEAMSGELARHTQAVLESLSGQVRVIDEKYADLPDRVTRLEHEIPRRGPR